jgi:hypothetical protein
MITAELIFITFYMGELRFVETDILPEHFYLHFRLCGNYLSERYFFQQKTRIKRKFYVEYTFIMTGSGHL